MLSQKEIFAFPGCNDYLGFVWTHPYICIIMSRSCILLPLILYQHILLQEKAYITGKIIHTAG